MSTDTYLIIDGSNEHRLSETLLSGLTSYRQYAGPYAGMAPFSKVYAKATVSGDRVADTCTGYITDKTD